MPAGLAGIYQTLSAPTPDNADRAAEAPGWDALPAVRCGLTPDEVIHKLDRAARRGTLPGFEPSGDGGFRVAVFGNPFDRELAATVTAAEGGSLIRCEPTLNRKAPLVLLVSVLVSIWPGVALVDTMIPASWGWWPTWTWYLPLVIVPTVLMLPGMWKKSEAAARAHALEQLGAIAKRTSGELIEAG